LEKFRSSFQIIELFNLFLLRRKFELRKVPKKQLNLEHAQGFEVQFQFQLDQNHLHLGYLLVVDQLNF
jgi:hypothetical protein